MFYKLFSDKNFLYEKGVNMVEIVKYVYVIIMFLSLILVTTNIEGKPFYCFQISFFTPYTIFYRIFVTLSYCFSSLQQRLWLAFTMQIVYIKGVNFLKYQSVWGKNVDVEVNTWTTQVGQNSIPSGQLKWVSFHFVIGLAP